MVEKTGCHFAFTTRDSLTDYHLHTGLIIMPSIRETQITLISLHGSPDFTEVDQVLFLSFIY